MTDDDVIVDRPLEGVGRLTMNRPAQRNALTPEMRGRLRASVESLVADPSVQALILTGAERHFCAGGDLARLAALPPEEVGALLQAGHALVRMIMDCPKPVIAAVPGSAAGGGLGLALACDVVMVTPRTKLVLPFNKIGLVPDYGLAYTIARRLGPARTRAVMLDPRTIGGTEAVAAGLADVLTDADALQEAAVALGARMTRSSIPSLAGIKSLTEVDRREREAVFAMEIKIQSECFGSPMFRNGVAAFLDR